jgi:putative transposase
VDQKLLVRNEYLITENRILRQQIAGRMRLSDGERKALAERGTKLGKKALEEVATIVTFDTILAWYCKFIAKKFDGSKQRKKLGRPRINADLEALVVRMAQENCSWGYDRIAGALALLGYTLSDQTVGCILKRHGIPPRTSSQKNHHLERMYSHAYRRVGGHRFLHHRSLDLMWSGDLYYILFFVQLASRKVHVAGVTP